MGRNKKQLKEICKGIEQKYDYLYLITCTLTKTKWPMNKERLEEMKIKHGSYEEFSKNYICRYATRLLKNGYSPIEIQEFNIKELKKEASKVKEEHIQKKTLKNAEKKKEKEIDFKWTPKGSTTVELTPENAKEYTTDTCLFPTKYLNAHRSCEDCNIVSICECSKILK